MKIGKTQETNSTYRLIVYTLYTDLFILKWDKKVLFLSELRWDQVECFYL